MLEKFINVIALPACRRNMPRLRFSSFVRLIIVEVCLGLHIRLDPGSTELQREHYGPYYVYVILLYKGKPR